MTLLDQEFPMFRKKQIEGFIDLSDGESEAIQAGVAGNRASIAPDSRSLQSSHSESVTHLPFMRNDLLVPF